jgi:hypothetical protein
VSNIVIPFHQHNATIPVLTVNDGISTLKNYNSPTVCCGSGLYAC